MTPACTVTPEAELRRLRAEVATYRQVAATLQQTITRSAARSQLLAEQSTVIKDARVQRHLDDANRWRQRAISAELESETLKTIIEQLWVGHAALFASIDTAPEEIA
jgi:hypothetical protein